jgi:hypothetical protein
MPNKPGAPKPTKKDSKTSKPAVKGDVLRTLSDEDLDKVAGGARPRGGKTTLNPTSSDGCCGG